MSCNCDEKDMQIKRLIDLITKNTDIRDCPIFDQVRCEEATPDWCFKEDEEFRECLMEWSKKEAE